MSAREKFSVTDCGKSAVTAWMSSKVTFSVSDCGKLAVMAHSKNLRPSVTLKIIIDGEVFEENAQGDGQYDAFMNALKKVYSIKGIALPMLTDYTVHIPPGGKSDALCETIITWMQNAKEFKTRGLDSDQTVSAIKATQKMLNQIG